MCPLVNEWALYVLGEQFGVEVDAFNMDYAGLL
jgi:hypothetical protein